MNDIKIHENNIRIKSITINNIKNVLNGTVYLDVPAKESFGASVVGLYGQNGSGKTALIWAFEILKDALSGIPLPVDTYYYIHQKSEEAKISFEFKVEANKKLYNVYYTLVLKKLPEKKFCIQAETLEYSYKGENKSETIKKRKIMELVLPDNSDEFEFCNYGPDTRIAEMTAINKQAKKKLSVIQALMLEKNISYIFNDKMRELMDVTFQNEYSEIIERLCFYGRINLFVLNKNSETSYNMNLLPLSMRLASANGISKADMLPIGLGPNTSDEYSFVIITTIIKQIDILLQTIIPNLNVEVVETGRRLGPDGQQQIVFELVSKRNEVITPLRYESEGIKKILCILSSLIAMYNDKSIFVAIDELDAGIFEYLLGEFLAEINKTGKGQLLFTSHDLRPLEVLENSNIYFTTTNKNNNFIQFIGIKGENNLRTKLFRAIDLGGQKESVYESTSSYQIGKAFRKAGNYGGGKR